MPDAIDLIATIKTTKLSGDGSSEITFDIPHSHLKSVLDIMKVNDRGETLFGVALVKLNRDEVYTNPMDPVDEVLSVGGNHGRKEQGRPTTEG